MENWPHLSTDAGKKARVARGKVVVVGLWAAAARPGVLKVLLRNRYTANGHQLRFFNMVGCAPRTNRCTSAPYNSFGTSEKRRKCPRAV